MLCSVEFEAGWGMLYTHLIKSLYVSREIKKMYMPDHQSTLILVSPVLVIVAGQSRSIARL